MFKNNGSVNEITFEIKFWYFVWGGRELFVWFLLGGIWCFLRVELKFFDFMSSYYLCNTFELVFGNQSINTY